jgi:hypothetical protein
MDITSWASLKDHNFVAFVDATSLIGGRDAVEEFIASGLWPLRWSFTFAVETKESPFSMVTVSMPQITPPIGEKDYVGAFVAPVEKAANVLVGRYNIMEHNSYKGLWHGRINRIFELVGVICQPCPEPPVCKRKMKAPDATEAPPVAKMLCKKLGHDKKLLRTGFGTST